MGRGHRLGRYLACLGLVLGSTPVVQLVLPTAASADQVRDAEWHLDFLKVAQAQQISKGAGVTVAVIDTGVDADHKDLRGAVLSGIDVTLSPADPADGRTDTDGHGTAMAALIAGQGHGQGAGVLGLAPGAKILPIRTHPADQVGSHGLSEGIRWAVDHGASVINMSFGTTDSPGLRSAISYAQQHDVVLVAGVPNTVGAQHQFPSSYPGVIAVAGVDRQGRHAEISTTGAQVALAAPAVDIMSADVGGGYAQEPGTSNATAIVSGAAALVRAKFPQLSAVEVAYRLTATADDRGVKGRDEVYGFGVLDLLGALTAEVGAVPQSSATALPVATDGPAAQPTFAAPSDGDSPVGRRVALVGGVCGGVVVIVVLGALLLVRRRRPAG